MIQMRAAGYSWPEISARLIGRTRKSAARRGKLLGLPCPKPAFNWTDGAKQRVADLWDAGRNSSQIAAEFGLTKSAIVGIVYRLGLPMRNPQAGQTKRKHTPRERNPRPVVWTEKRKARAVELWARGLSAAAIGEKIGVTKSQVQRLAATNRDDLFPRVGRPKHQVSSMREGTESATYADFERRNERFLALLHKHHGSSMEAVA
jgi:hypothetical protein